MEEKILTNRFLKKISKFKQVVLDSSCFIYQFSSHPRFAPLTYELFKNIENGKLQAATSTISLVEIFVKPEKEQELELIKNYEALLLNFPNLKIFPLDWGLAKLAAQIRAKYSFRSPDAIQLGLAITTQADAFITNDKKLKRFKEIKVLVLEDFIG